MMTIGDALFFFPNLIIDKFVKYDKIETMELYNFLPFAIFIIVILFITTSLQSFSSRKQQYRYHAKKYIMTRSETDLYKKLSVSFADHYVIVPQVHLSSLFNEKIKGQNWRAAFSHINGKSVDFVFLDRRTFEVICAIECDDYTHQRDDRIIRDDEVNRIFSDSELPLIRLDHTLRKTSSEISEEIKKVLNRH